VNRIILAEVDYSYTEEEEDLEPLDDDEIFFSSPKLNFSLGDSEEEKRELREAMWEQFRLGACEMVVFPNKTAEIVTPWDRSHLENQAEERGITLRFISYKEYLELQARNARAARSSSLAPTIQRAASPMARKLLRRDRNAR
jgi:hypothetical protein